MNCEVTYHHYIQVCQFSTKLLRLHFDLDVVLSQLDKRLFSFVNSLGALDREEHSL